MNEILRLEKLRKTYARAFDDLEILKGADLTIHEGETVAIIGKSGSGKSTLLNLAALLDSKSGGRIFYDGIDTDTLSASEVEERRRTFMGFVFQNSMLLEDFSAIENVEFPLLIQGRSRKEAEKIAENLISSIGLENRRDHLPSELSGGERQRIAIARALSSGARLIFADEPTGSLDEQSRRETEELILSIPQDGRRAVLLVTHDLELARKADRLLELKGGCLEELDP